MELIIKEAALSSGIIDFSDPKRLEIGDDFTYYTLDGSLNYKTPVLYAMVDQYQGLFNINTVDAEVIPTRSYALADKFNLLRYVRSGSPYGLRTNTFAPDADIWCSLFLIEGR